MLGAVLGDLCGSIYEDINYKKIPSELMHPRCHFTDDSVLTSAVTSAFLRCSNVMSFQKIKATKISEQMLQDTVISEILVYTKKYPWAGYGANFVKWIHSEHHHPYNSYGNGAAMRTSCCGWVAQSREEAIKFAKCVANITHNHPDGVKGAVVVSECIYLLKHGCTKSDIFNIVSEYYDMDFSLDEIRSEYKFSLAANHSVPQAIMAFLEGTNFEEVIKLAISIGGDSDTISAIAGSLAELYYPIPNKLKQFAVEHIPEDILNPIIYAEEIWK